MVLQFLISQLACADIHIRIVKCIINIRVERTVDSTIIPIPANNTNCLAVLAPSPLSANYTMVRYLLNHDITSVP